MTNDKPAEVLQKVKLKDGRIMNYLHEKNGRHVFLGDVRVLSVWMMALVIFILLTSILVGFYQVTLMTEIANKLSGEIAITQRVCAGEYLSPNYISPTDVSDDQNR